MVYAWHTKLSMSFLCLILSNIPHLCYNSLILSTLGKIFSRWHIEIFFFFFFQKTGFDILHWRQFAWNVKFCFLGKIRKISSVCHLLNMPIRVLIVKQHLPWSHLANFYKVSYGTTLGQVCSNDHTLSTRWLPDPYMVEHLKCVCPEPRKHWGWILICSKIQLSRRSSGVPKSGLISRVDITKKMPIQIYRKFHIQKLKKFR